LEESSLKSGIQDLKQTN